jgi:hypothetical protein
VMASLEGDTEIWSDRSDGLSWGLHWIWSDSSDGLSRGWHWNLVW